jgi:glutaredoxin
MYTIYTKDGCPYCEKVKQVLGMLNQSYREYELGVDFTREEFYNEFGEGSTFPRVLYNDTLIGGCTETVKYLKEQKLI